MAGLKEVSLSLSLSGLGGEKVKGRLMEWFEKMVFPVKKLWTSASSRAKSRKTGGLLKLRDDIQTCGYQDVHIMWEMLSRTESESIPRRVAKRRRPFWRIFVWSNHNTASSFSTNHA